MNDKNFKVRECVLGQVFPNIKCKAVGKLAPKWEDPYKVIWIPRWWAYEFEDIERRRLERSLNFVCLKKYYHYLDCFSYYKA